MRSLWTSAAALGLIAIAPALARAQNSPTAKNLLELQPILKGVEYEIPADAASIDACKIETVFNAKKKAIGVALRDGQGKLLRRFVDSDGNNKMDQWSYYQDGFEVYRESDLNNDRSPDECRWLNAGGTRVAEVARGKIVGWKRVSAEEASKVFVQGLVAPDLGLLETVLATPEDLTGLGLAAGVVDQVAAAAARRADDVRALQKGLIGWNKKTVWHRLDGYTMPHVIPADAASGLPNDLFLYENAVIFAGPANGQTASSKVAFLQVPEMVKVGETWKFVELPRAVDPDKPLVAGEGGIRSWVFRQQAGPRNGDPEVEEALKALAEFDNANAKVQAEGGKKELAQFHVGRVPRLNKVFKAVKDPEEKKPYARQIIDSLAAAYQTGLYPEGLDLIEKFIKGDGRVVLSYGSFRIIQAVFAEKNEQPGANLMVNQKKWMTDLKAFLDHFPKADEAPDALIQLASANEFNAEEEEARKYYDQLARDFPATDAGKKAAGAIKRLELVGKALDLRGPGLDGKEIDTSRYKGKTLLVTFWASWADPVRRDLPELTKLYQKYRGKDFEIVGVNLDNDRADLDAFLKENSLPWPQIFEPGGIEKSRFATEYGIIALPTMVLVDPQGKVINRNIRTAAELDRQLDKALGAKQSGVALDR